MRSREVAYRPAVVRVNSYWNEFQLNFMLKVYTRISLGEFNFCQYRPNIPPTLHET
jgi:hypothetical protein